MKKLKAWFHAHLPSKRRLIQLYAALLYNANLKGFATGRIYHGATKGLCAPGLNCYSCPGAVTACPLGSLQNALANSRARLPYYIFGILLLYGLLFGRAICGFLCPFGLLQELLHKIRTPKLRKSKWTRSLSYLKYPLLILLCIVYPILYMLKDGTLPAFCKFVCPAGTLEGAVSLLSNATNSAMFRMLGPLFTWKFVLLCISLLGAVFIYRFFCRFFCPLGAIYGLFNRYALLGMKVEEEKCIHCGLCTGHCGMDVRRVGDHECIECGECAALCPTGAITRKGSRLILPKSEIEPAKKETKKRLSARAVAVVLALCLLLAALLYYNIFDLSSSAYGGAVGDPCPSFSVPLYGEGESVFDPSVNEGRITVLNFWGIWCAPCKEELPDFDRLADAYRDRVTVLAIHSALDSEGAPAYIDTYFPDSAIRFGFDTADDAFFTALGGRDVYPITVVLDASGFVLARFEGKVDYETLTALIEEKL